MTLPAMGANAPVFGFTAVKSFVKRARMWLDESDTGRYQCFYADGFSYPQWAPAMRNA